MKHTILILGLILSVSILSAQEKKDIQEYSKGLSFSSVEEDEAMASVGFRNSFSVNVPTDDRRLVARVWKTYVSSRFNGRTKYDRKAKEYVTHKADVSPVASQPVNLIGKPEKFGSNVRFTLWLDSDGEYVKSVNSPRKAREVQAILEDFVVQVEKEKVRLHLEEEEKELKKLEHRLRRLEHANTRYHREIEMAKERIKRMEENIIKNIQDQQDANQDILQQQEKVKSVKDTLHSIN